MPDVPVAEDYIRVDYKGISVCYTRPLDGGGRTFGQDYLKVLPFRIGRRERVFEWCTGPGFIGFSLLAHGLCDTLCLADINPAAIAACETTIRENGLEDRVTLYHSDCLDQIPETEAWDLVVGNPPHSGIRRDIPHRPPELLYFDENWTVHKRFYASVGRFLKPQAVILIIECVRWSEAEDFRAMIEDSGLVLRRSFACEKDPDKYYVWVEKPAAV